MLVEYWQQCALGSVLIKEDSALPTGIARFSVVAGSFQDAPVHTAAQLDRFYVAEHIKTGLTITKVELSVLDFKSYSDNFQPSVNIKVFYTDPVFGVQTTIKCECGAEKCNLPFHSNWCGKYKQ